MAGTAPKTNALADLRFARRCSQERLAEAARALGATSMTRDRLTRIELEDLFATGEEAVALAKALSQLPVRRLGRRELVTVGELALRVDALGATRGRRPQGHRRQRSRLVAATS